MIYSASVIRSSLALALLAGACGPSVSAIYEANIRFEHCYRLDLDPKVASGHRMTCWKEWSRRYTYGQTRDRLEYAKKRIALLGTGDNSRPELDLSVSDAGVSASEAPVPTNIHAPPPPTIPTAAPPGTADAGATDESAGDASAASPRVEPPGAACTAECKSSWRACLDVCSPDAGKKRGSCKSCDADYGRCVQRCYK